MGSRTRRGSGVMGKMKEEFMRLQETPIMEACSECQGTGGVEYEVARPQSFSRDVGVIDVEMEVCETCSGDGEIERLCDCGEPVTLIMGQDAEVCEECADETV